MTRFARWPSTPPGASRRGRAEVTSAEPDGHRWARTGPARPVDNGGALAADEVASARRGVRARSSPRGQHRASQPHAGPRGSSRRAPAAILAAWLDRWTTPPDRLPALAPPRLAPGARCRRSSPLDSGSFPGPAGGRWPPSASPGSPSPPAASARAGALLGLVDRPGLLRPAAALVGRLRRRAAVAGARHARGALRRARRRPRCRSAWRVPGGRAGTVARRHRALGRCRRRCAPGCRSAGSPGGGSRSPRPTRPPSAGRPSAGPPGHRGRRRRRRLPGRRRRRLRGRRAAARRRPRPGPAAAGRGARRCAAAAARSAARLGTSARTATARRAGRRRPGRRPDRRARLQRPAPGGARQPRPRHPGLARTQVARRARSPAPDLVLWPENSSDIDPLRNPDAYAGDQRDGRRDRRRRCWSGPSCSGPGDHISNAGDRLGTDTARPRPGRGQRYVKRHPVPFAEYIPYRSFFRMFSDKVDLVTPGLRRRATGSGVLHAGPARRRRRHLLRGGLRRPRPRHRSGPAPTCSSSRPTTRPSATPTRASSSWRCRGCGRSRPAGPSCTSRPSA